MPVKGVNVLIKSATNESQQSESMILSPTQEFNSEATQSTKGLESSRMNLTGSSSITSKYHLKKPRKHVPEALEKQKSLIHGEGRFAHEKHIEDKSDSIKHPAHINSSSDHGSTQSFHLGH